MSFPVIGSVSISINLKEARLTAIISALYNHVEDQMLKVKLLKN